MEAKGDPRSGPPKPLPRKRGDLKGFLLSSRHWRTQPKRSAARESFNSAKKFRRESSRDGPIPHPVASSGAHPARRASHPPRRSPTGAHRARSSGRQGSVGEIRAAQVRDHQERIPRVRGPLEERAVLGPSHCGRDRGRVRPGPRDSAAAGALGRGPGTRAPSRAPQDGCRLEGRRAGARPREPGELGEPGAARAEAQSPAGPGIGGCPDQHVPSAK